MTVLRAPEQVHDAYIGYDNLGESATITTDSEASGFSAANVSDYFTYDFWKPDTGGTHYIEFQLATASACDYFAMYAQDAHLQGGTVKLQYWDGVAFIDAVSMVPSDGAPVFVLFTEISSDRFRLEVTAINPACVGVVMFGKAMPIPYGLKQGFASPHNAQLSRDVTNESETGNYIGRTIRKEAVPFSFGTELLQYDWFISDWRPFLRHAERKPFFFKWSNTTYTTESTWCWLSGRVSTPSFDDAHFSSIEVPCKGLVE